MIYNVLIADDEYFIRKRISKIINWEEAGLHLVGEAENGDEVLDYLNKHDIHILLLDIKMPGKNGLDVMDHIATKGLGTKVIILSGYNDFAYAQKALKLRAVDYLVKPVSRDVLLESLKACCESLHILYSQQSKTNVLSLLRSYGLEANVLDHVNQCLKSKEDPRACYSPLVVAMMEYLHAHYLDYELNIGRLAQHFKRSPSHLGGAFKKATGHSLVHYIEQLRMDHAIMLLKTQQYTVTEIASLVGYGDVYYFSRRFKKMFGSSPKNYLPPPLKIQCNTETF